jgi:hypothetical protein
MTLYSTQSSVGVFGKGQFQSIPSPLATVVKKHNKNLASDTCAVSSIYNDDGRIYVLRLVDLLQITTPIDHGTPKKDKRIACNIVHY